MTSFDEAAVKRRRFAERLAKRLEESLPGAAQRKAAQRKMEPGLAFGRHFHRAPSDARHAAVVILLDFRQGVWTVPLVLRPDHMKAHAGQIGLPGGAVETNENSRQAALRELREELGIPSKDVRMLGSLTPIWVYATNFAVTPWLAVARGDLTTRPNAAEVAEVLDVPLKHLLDPSRRGMVHQRQGSLEFSAPCYCWRDHQIWGATAIMLSELLALIELAPNLFRP